MKSLVVTLHQLTVNQRQLNKNAGKRRVSLSGGNETQQEEKTLIIKIQAKQIGIEKPITVVPSLFLQRRTTKMARFINKVNIQSLQEQIKAENNANGESDDEESEKAQSDLDKLKADLEDAKSDDNDLDSEDEIVEESFTYLKDVLKLTTKQVEKAERHLGGYQDLMTYVAYVMGRIKGNTDAELLAGKNEADQDMTDQDPKQN